jgi:hypothetical protein
MMSNQKRWFNVWVGIGLLLQNSLDQGLTIGP